MRYTTFGRRTGCGFPSTRSAQATSARSGARATRERVAQDLRPLRRGGRHADRHADGYQNGESEKLLGEFLAADRDHFVVATKYTRGATPRPDVTATGNSRKNMVRSVEESLTRLSTDRIDLYWVHLPDRVTPIEEILRGLDDLVSAGKILHAACPTSRPGGSRARRRADLRGWAPSPASRSSTAWSSAPPTASCCRWPRRWGWVSRCGRRSAAAC